MAGEIKADIENIDNIRRKLTVTVPGEEVDQEFQRVYREMRKNASIPGFRRGHVPIRIIRQLYGEEVRSEVAQKVISRSYQKALEQTGVEPVSNPSINDFDLTEGKPLTFEAEVEIRPEIKLGEYKGLKVTKKVDEVGDEDIDKVLEDLRQKIAPVETVREERPVREGDIAVIDFEGYREGQPVEGARGTEYPLEIGSGTFIPGFEDALVGAKAGQEKKFVLTFPEDYGEESLAGQEIQFIVNVKVIKERVPPEIDDEFARDVGDHKDLNDLKDKIRENISSIREKESLSEVKKEIVEKLIAQVDFDLPPSMMEREKASIIRDYSRRLSIRGLPEEDIKKQIDESLKDIEGAASRNIKASMILDEIARRDEIKVEKQDLDKALKQMADNQKRPIGEIRKEMIKAGALEGYSQLILEEKTLDFLITQAEITEEKSKGKEGGEKA